MKFRYLTIEDGLPSNRVSCIFRDSRDYLWIGTDIGLCRFDGEKIKTFSSSLTDTTSLSNGNVYCIFEDIKGNLWVGTAFGLNLFKPETESFEHFFSDSTKQNSLSENYISDILQDKNGSMWISTMHGFNKYNPETNDFKRYFIPVTNNKKNNNEISDIFYDSVNTLWFGTNDNVLWSFKIHEDKFEKYIIPAIAANSNEAKRIAIEGKNVWIGTMGSGLFVYNIETKKCEKFPLAIDGKGTSGKYINSIAIDKNKYLLIGIDQGGLIRLDLQSLKMVYCL
jgi:ligand-binding sensor domain-containing protein